MRKRKHKLRSSEGNRIIEMGKMAERYSWTRGEFLLQPRDFFGAVHYGTKPGHFETSKIHFPTSEGESEVSERASERADERVAQYLRLDSCLFQTTVRSGATSSITYAISHKPDGARPHSHHGQSQILHRESSHAFAA